MAGFTATVFVVQFQKFLKDVQDDMCRFRRVKHISGVTEELKAADQMAWVGAMSSIRNRAEEIILREMIYGEDVV